MSDMVGRLSSLADRELERHEKRSPLNDALERAGIDIRAGEFAVLVTSTAIGAAFVGLALSGPLFGIVFAVATIGGFRAAVAVKESRRRARFADQLGDTLQAMAGALRAGHGLTQAVDLIATEADDPTRQEFRRVIVETRLGKALIDALRASAVRLRNEDFNWVVEAIDIQREVGGDLAEVLDHVAETIRARNRVQRQIRALSAEGRLSAAILLAMPIAMFGIIGLTNPAYMSELTDSSAGHILLVFGAVLMTIGATWMRRLIRLVF
jgi:tight adherence protein B